MASLGGPPFGGKGSYTTTEMPKGYRKRARKNEAWSLTIPKWVNWLLSSAAILFLMGSVVSQVKVGEEFTASVKEPTVANVQPATVEDSTDGDFPSIALVGIFGAATIPGGIVALLLMTRKSRFSNGIALDDRARARELWEGFVARHGVLRERLLEVETSWDMIFKYPALTDASVVTTRQFHRALRVADSLSSEPPSNLDLSMDLSKLPYPQLVLDAEDAWLAAWDYAQRTGAELIPGEERRKIDRILQLLSMARDSGGSEHERAVAYQRAEKLIGELRFVRIPETALRAIEAEQRMMIEAASADLQPADSGLLLQSVR